MKFIGFNFNKIFMEKTSDEFNNLKISSNLNISNILKVDSTILNNEEKIIIVDFDYNITYSPNIAKIEFKGKVILSLQEELAKKVLEQWRDKIVQEEIKVPVFNVIFKKTNLRALQFEEEFNLPFHLPLPTLKKEELRNKEDSNNFIQ